MVRRIMKSSRASILSLSLVGCANAPVERLAIPFDIDRLSAAQRGVIRALNATDPTPYLERTRPVLFQIVQARCDADEVRQGGPIQRPADVLIQAIGEIEDGRLVDYGWIERAETGEKVWTMRAEDTVPAGGAARNRRVLARIRLQPGRYRLRYRSNAKHAYGDWEGAAPARPSYYGIAVFNLGALPRIDAALRAAGLPDLATTLR